MLRCRLRVSTIKVQNLALTLDKVRYVMGCVFVEAKKAPLPFEMLTREAVVSVLWKGEGSLVEELLSCMTPHVEEDLLKDLKSRIHAHDPSCSDDLRRELHKSILWLRDEVRNLPCTYKCMHDAAADLIHIYAYTKCFFRIREYKSVTSLCLFTLVLLTWDQSTVISWVVPSMAPNNNLPGTQHHPPSKICKH